MIYVMACCGDVADPSPAPTLDRLRHGVTRPLDTHCDDVSPAIAEVLHRALDITERHEFPTTAVLLARRLGTLAPTPSVSVRDEPSHDHDGAPPVAPVEVVVHTDDPAKVTRVAEVPDSPRPAARQSRATLALAAVLGIAAVVGGVTLLRGYFASVRARPPRESRPGRRGEISPRRPERNALQKDRATDRSSSERRGRSRRRASEGAQRTPTATSNASTAGRRPRAPTPLRRPPASRSSASPSSSRTASNTSSSP